MPRPLFIRRSRHVNFLMDQELFDKSLQVMQQYGYKSFTDFAHRAITEFVAKLDTGDYVGASAAAEPGKLRLALDDNSPLTAQIDVEEIQKAVEQPSDISPELRKLLGKTE